MLPTQARLWDELLDTGGGALCRRRFNRSLLLLGRRDCLLLPTLYAVCLDHARDRTTSIRVQDRCDRLVNRNSRFFHKLGRVEAYSELPPAGLHSYRLACVLSREVAQQFRQGDSSDQHPDDGAPLSQVRDSEAEPGIE